MALCAGPGPGEPSLWAGRGDSLSVSGDGIRRAKAGLSSGVISGAPRMCLPLKDLCRLFASGWNSTSEIYFP